MITIIIKCSNTALLTWLPKLSDCCLLQMNIIWFTIPFDRRYTSCLQARWRTWTQVFGEQTSDSLSSPQRSQNLAVVFTCKRTRGDWGEEKIVRMTDDAPFRCCDPFEHLCRGESQLVFSRFQLLQGSFVRQLVEVLVYLVRSVIY